ncbi:MAG: hypothetical protein H7Y88_01030 [Phycisphaerales bacterium]|nr:hypothetical protein [Phycisphaerales bacterium]
MSSAALTPSRSPIAGSAPSSAAGITRAQIIGLAQSGRAWEFIPFGLLALRHTPHDVQMRLLVVASYARLGLRTAALEHLEVAATQAPGEPAIEQLRSVASAMTDDRMTLEARVRTCRANVAAIGDNGGGGGARVLVESGLEAWFARTTDEEWFRAIGGNVVRRSSTGEWVRFADDAAAAASLELPLVAQTGPSAPFTIEGICPPWLLVRVAAQRPLRAEGHWPRIRVVQADILELLDGLAMTDLRTVLSAPRLELFVGADAGTEFIARLRGQFGAIINGPVVTSGGLRTRATCEGQSIDRLHSAALAQQHVDESHLLARLRALYAGRERDWWGRRYQEALSGSGAPLRILVPTCRYSSFVRHSSQDLAASFERAGIRAEILEESDDSSHFTATSYARTLLRLEPDLIVLINYTRRNIGTVIPSEVPVVTWIQDAMPHLFRQQTGPGLGELDFVAGHLYPELFERFGYPHSRTLAVPVVACSRKFHPSAIDSNSQKRFGCEIAYVSHQSETPSDMHSRLVREASRSGTDPIVVRVLERLEPQVRQIAQAISERNAQTELPRLTSEAIRAEFGTEPDPCMVTLVLKQYSEPYAERIVRHQTLAWAANAARRRGWRLKLFGRGWACHSELREFASGDVPHGEELRACYQAAAVHLHMSSRTLMHQRVLECVLSGGFPLCRLVVNDAQGLKDWLLHQVFAKGEEAPVCSLKYKVPGYPITDHPELMRLACFRQHMGQLQEWAMWFHEYRREKALAGSRVPHREELALWVLGESPDNVFIDAEGLERRVAAVLESPGLRRGLAEMARRRVGEYLTYDSLRERMLDLVRTGLGAGNAPEGIS